MKKIISLICIPAFLYLFFISINTTLAQNNQNSNNSNNQNQSPSSSPTSTPLPDPNPSVPTITLPTGILNVGNSYNFSFRSIDPNSLMLRYEYQFDGGEIRDEPTFFFQSAYNSGAIVTITKSWQTSGSHTLRARSKNTNNIYSNWSNNYNFNITEPNIAPNDPVITNNSSVVKGFSIDFNIVATDDNDDFIKYEIDWNNNSVSDEIVPSQTPIPTPLSANYVNSGTTLIAKKIWNAAGTYTVKFRAVDIHGLASNWVSRTVIVNKVNFPPNEPSVSLANGQGGIIYTNTSYNFNFISSDPENDSLIFYVDWDNNGQIDDVLPRYMPSYTPTPTPSGIIAVTEVGSNPSTLWKTAGNYSFKAYVGDYEGNFSSTVNIPVTVVQSPTPTVTLTATPSFLTPGVPATIKITWSSTNANSCHTYGISWPGSTNTSGTFTTGIIAGPIQYTLICNGNGTAATSTVAVNYPTNTTGWGWSSNIGHISFSSSNAGAMTTDPYGVTIATSSSVGMMGGYAWSSNIGWISFESGDSSHTNGIVDFDTGKVTGWARACSATISGDCKGAGRTDGWDGWISLSGLNHESPTPDGSKGITFDKASGKFSGFAWGGEVIGWLTFETVTPVTCSTCTQPLGIPSCSVFKADPSTFPYSGGNAKLLWSLQNVNTSSNACNITTAEGSNISLNSLTGESNINVPSNSSASSDSIRTYSLKCPTYSLICKTNIIVERNNVGEPNSPGKMWVENNPDKTITTIRQGQNAIINWKLGSYTGCSGINIINPGNRLPNANTWYNNSVKKATISGLTVGSYTLGIDCTDDGSGNAKSLNSVQIIVKSPKEEEI